MNKEHVDRLGWVGDPDRMRTGEFDLVGLDRADEWAIDEAHDRLLWETEQELRGALDGSSYEFRSHEIVPGPGDVYVKVIARRKDGVA